MLYIIAYLCLEQPKAPVLKMARMIVENRATEVNDAFECSGDIGFPAAGYLELQISRSLNDFESLITSNDSSVVYENLTVTLVDYTDGVGCNDTINSFRITFSSIPMALHNAKLRCVMKPFQNSDYNEMISSHGVVKVLDGKSRYHVSLKYMIIYISFYKFIKYILCVSVLVLSRTVQVF